MVKQTKQPGSPDQLTESGNDTPRVFKKYDKATLEIFGRSRLLEFIIPDNL